MLKDRPNLLEDLLYGLISIDIPDLFLLLELANHLQSLLPICLESLPDDLRRVITPPFPRPDLQPPQHLLLAAHQVQHERTEGVVFHEPSPGVEVLQVAREAVDHEEPSARRRLHLVLEQLDGDGAGDDLSFRDDLANGAAELRRRPLLLIPQQLACRQVQKPEVPLDESRLRALARARPAQHEHHLESPHASIIKQMQWSDGEGTSHSVLGDSQLLSVLKLVGRPLLVLGRVVLLQLRMLPPQVLVQLALLQILLVQGLVALLQTGDPLEQLLHLLALVPARAHAVETLEDARVLLNGESQRLQLLLGEVLLLEPLEDALQFAVVLAEGLLHLRQLRSLLLEPLEVLALLHHDLLPALGLELLDGHVGRALPARLEQRLVEGLLVGDEPALVVDLLLVLCEPLPAHLRLLLLDLLSDQELQAETGTLAEEVLHGGELRLALRQRPPQQPRLAERLQLHAQRRQVERSCVKDIADLISEPLHPLLQLADRTHYYILQGRGGAGARGQFPGAFLQKAAGEGGGGWARVQEAAAQMEAWSEILST